MNKLENFLSKSITDHKAFAVALNNAIKEVRAEELNINFTDLMFNGDTKSIKEINKSSIYSINHSPNLEAIPERLKSVGQSWENTAVVYRGTRLPDNSGSFGFDGIHATPQIHVANGYATGTTNNSTAIGRLLNHIEGGFITAYEVPLSTRTYNNFEYEDIKKSGIDQQKSTLQDLKDNLLKVSTKDKSEFYLDANDAPSPALNSYYSLVGNKSHYEAILPSDTAVSDLYFKNSKDIIKVDLNNPKWDQLLARVQEASLRDFYEVIPLEKLSQQTVYINENSENKDILNKAKELIQKQKEDFINAPWECSSMKDVSLANSQYVEKRPYINNSRCVGSAMETSNIEKPEVTQKLEKLVDAIRTNDLGLAKSVLTEIENKKESTISTDKELSVNNILALRKVFNETNTQTAKLTM